MTPNYPLFLNLTDRHTLVVGGGPVAERRIRGLLDNRARVTVVSPWATEAIRDWTAAGQVTWQQRD